MVIGKMILFVMVLDLALGLDCVHDHFTRNATKHFVNDLTDGRMLQSENKGRFLLHHIQAPNLRRLHAGACGRQNRNQPHQKSHEHHGHILLQYYICHSAAPPLLP